MVSSSNQPPEQLAAHRVLTEGSRGSRHVIAARSGHWIQFDQPELIIAIIRELVEKAREDSSTLLPSSDDFDRTGRVEFTE